MLANRESSRRRQKTLPGAEAGGQTKESGEGLLTRPELAEALKVSLHTVDRMLADGEIPHVRLRGTLVRFYLPDVVRTLVATATTRKRGPGREAA